MTVTTPPVRPVAPLATPDGVDAVRRGVELERVDGAVRVETTLTTTLGDQPARIWPLLTRGPRLARWYGPVTGHLVEGGDFSTIAGAHGRILEVEAPHRLHLTWEYAENVDDLQLALDPQDDGMSEFRLVHRGNVPAEIFAEYGPGAMAIGWDIAVLGLAAYTHGWDGLRLEIPTPGPIWLASPEGAAWVRAWSIRWAAASVAAGTDDEEARRAEIATTRAYGVPVGDDADPRTAV